MTSHRLPQGHRPPSLLTTLAVCAIAVLAAGPWGALVAVIRRNPALGLIVGCALFMLIVILLQIYLSNRPVRGATWNNPLELEEGEDGYEPAALEISASPDALAGVCGDDDSGWLDLDLDSTQPLMTLGEDTIRMEPVEPTFAGEIEWPDAELVDDAAQKMQRSRVNFTRINPITDSGWRVYWETLNPHSKEACRRQARAVLEAAAATGLGIGTGQIVGVAQEATEADGRTLVKLGGDLVPPSPTPRPTMDDLGMAEPDFEEVIERALCEAFNPPDEDAAAEYIYTEAIRKAAEFIEAQPCSCIAPPPGETAPINDGDCCHRCEVLGRYQDVREER